MFSLCLRRTEEIYERLRIQRLYIKCNDKVGAMCQLVEGSFRGNEREFPTVWVAELFGRRRLKHYIRQTFKTLFGS
jgi:hypothetical protein